MPVSAAALPFDLERLPDRAIGKGVDASVLRRLHGTDLDAVADLYERRARWMNERGIRQWRPDDSRLRRHFSGRLAEGGGLGIDGPDGQLLAALLLDNGSALWDAYPHPWPEPVLHLEKLMTAPEAPAGLGAAFLAQAEALLASCGLGLLRMDSVEASLVLRRFWQGRGYLARGVVPYHDGTPVLLHEKRLGPLPGDHDFPLLPGDLLSGPFPGAIRATLLFVVRDGRVLLIHKKRGHGAGNINGPGGKCDAGETPRQCAVREVAEELHIDVAEPEYRGELRWIGTGGFHIHGFAYVSTDFSGTPTETAEARPEWFDLDAVPYPRMWADDLMWLPWVLEGEGVRAAFLSHEDRIEAAHLEFGAGPEPEQ
jgi:8-oxo-dGTP diphosphatase